MKTLVIEKDRVRHNANLIKEKAGSSQLYAVLTGNGHGAGLIPLAKLLRDEGIGRFAVSEPSEALALRKAGFVEEEILMLRSTTDPKELVTLMDDNIICTIGSHDSGVALNALAEQHSTVVEAHIQVDTGMGYGGFLTDEPDKVLSMYRYLPSVALSGIYTQIHGKSNKERQVTAQLELLNQLTNAIIKEGFETGIVHAAGSSALMQYEFAKLGGVRVGSAFLGRCHNATAHGLQVVGHGEVRVEEVRWLPKGHTIGKGKPITLKKPTRVAVLPVGYQNGFGVQIPRNSSLWQMITNWFRQRRIWVRIGDQKARVIGRLGDIETLIDVTDLKCTPGDIASFSLNPLYARGMTVELR